MYIVAEGLDGAGKSTILERLFQHGEKAWQEYLAHPVSDVLPPVQVMKHRFPSPLTHVGEDPGGGIGRIIRDVMEGKRELDHQCFMYLFMAEAIQAEKWIKKHHRRDIFLLIDRHASTTGPVYQQDHHAKEDVLQVYRSHRFEVPDLILIFDIDYATHIARRRARNNQHEDLVFERDDEARFARMRSDYLSYLRGGHHQFPAAHFVRIDATQDLDSVENQVWRAVWKTDAYMKTA
jgi:thymidylate kinase